MNIQEQATKALDVLESAEVMQEFDDHLWIRVERDLWEDFTGESQDALLDEAALYMRQWIDIHNMTPNDAFHSREFLRVLTNKLVELGVKSDDQG